MTYVGATDARGALELGVNHTATAGDILLVIRNIHVHTLPAGHFNLRAVRDRGHAGTHEARLRGDRALAHGGGLIARIDDDANQRLVHTSHHARVNDVKKYHTSIAVARLARSRLAMHAPPRARDANPIASTHTRPSPLRRQSIRAIGARVRRLERAGDDACVREHTRSVVSRAP